MRVLGTVLWTRGVDAINVLDVFCSNNTLLAKHSSAGLLTM